MKARLLSFLIGMTFGSLGYGVASQFRTSALAPLSRVPSLESSITGNSFSEIQNYRARFEDLGARYRAEVRFRCHTSEEAIDKLEEGLSEFRGTAQEFILVQDLLRTLNKSERYDHWLEVYLNILYCYPTQRLVGQQAGAAVRAAQATGCETELTAAFVHLMATPLDFQAKTAVKRALAALQGPNQN